MTDTVQPTIAEREPRPGDEAEQPWYFTFGANHTHPVTGESLGQAYIEILGTCDSTRTAMFAAFGNRWSHQYESAERAGVERYALRRIDLPATAPAPRYTVGIEVLTPALRAIGNATRDKLDSRVQADATVAIVMRRDLEPLRVPETDADWKSAWSGKPTDILARLLRRARVCAYPHDAEMLMPGPDVLAALEGRPVGGYTEAVEVRWGVVKTGWFVLRELRLPSGEQDFAWMLVEDRIECRLLGCPVAQGIPTACAVVTIQGRGIQHLDAFNPVAVRIPATTEVEA